MKTHYSKLIILIISLFLNLGIVSCNSDSAASTNKAPITIYYGGDIITMEGDKPNYAEAIAIQGDKIIFVGSKEDAQKYEDKTTQWIDLKGKTLLPGFIDPHLHPVIAATILPLEIVSAMSWKTPTGYTQPIKDRAMFINRLQELDKKYTKSSEPLIVWGYFKPYHGEITREDLNKISVQRPIIVWQRSCHEIILNDAALQYFKLTEENFKTAPQYCNWKKGHVWEAGLFKQVIHSLLKTEQCS